MIEKYVAFTIAFVLMLGNHFFKTKKESKSDFQKSSATGKVLIFLALFAFLYGIMQTVKDQKRQKQQNILSQVKIKDDSLLLAKRWEFDTTRFKQLLDSSKIIIENNIATSEKLNKSLSAAERILLSTHQQSLSLQSNLLLTQKLQFPLPEIIPVSYIFKYELTHESDSSLVKYLDSVIQSNNKELINDIEGYVSFHLERLDQQKVDVISRIMHFFNFCTIDFVKNDEPIFRMEMSYKSMLEPDNLEMKINSTFKYDTMQKVIHFNSKNYTIKHDQVRKEGVNSLVDLDQTQIYITSHPLFNDGFDPTRSLAILVFHLEKRDIWFGYFFPYSATDEMVDVLRKRDVRIRKNDPFFFNWDVDLKLLRGEQTSIKNPDSVRIPAGYMSLRHSKYKK